MRDYTPQISRLFAGLIALGVSASSCAYAKEAALKDIEQIPPSCLESPYGPGNWLAKLEHGGRNRRYIVHVPPGYEKDRPVPVVLFFHGGGGSALGTRSWPGWDALADKKDFIVVYPFGTGFLRNRLLTFNAGSNCCGYAKNKNVDDVGFVAAMLDDLGKSFCVDPARVYATGFSNGAIMSYRLACELPDRIAAIGPVSGTLGLGLGPCKTSRAVSVIHFHGTGDAFEPFKGGRGKPFPGKLRGNPYRSVEDTVATWTSLIGASRKPTSTLQEGDATRETFGGGRNGSEFVLWTLKGGGHTWPGGGEMPQEWFLGKKIRDVSATRLIWEFFVKHPKKG
jgi:polyhydroxybutyrate depolymerase